MDVQLIILAAGVSAAVATGIGGIAVLSKAFAGRTTRQRLEDVTADEYLDDGVAPGDIDGSGADGLAAQKVLAAAIESIQNETVVTIT